MRLGSFFDGIGGWLIAAERAGIEPVWASEIEKFPLSVTNKYFPKVKQLGDITKIDVDKLEPVDIICAGSPCFVAGTRILTHSCMKAVEDVKVGDAVIGDDCKWHKVVKTMVNTTNAVYTIKAQGLLETKATANHPIYVRHMEMRGNEWVFSNPEYVSVKDLMKGDFIGFPIIKCERNEMNVTHEEAWLIGRYIADGYISNDKNSERLMSLCLMCGKGAGEKYIHSEYLNLPKDLLKTLIEGYMWFKCNNINKVTTISKNLALSLQTAVHKVYEVPAKVYFTQHDTYQVTWLDKVPKQSQAIVKDGYIWQPIRSITKKEVKTSVYNLEVNDVHSYTANGMMVHNCQDLSVAGKREGLAGERSGLFRTAINLVHGLRERTGYPRYFVWENVPGAFSSNHGHDFRTVLEEIAKTKIPMPKSGRWATAGMVECDGCTIEWRVLDAQYWGVPQRRKRIFLVADFMPSKRGGQKILFESKGMPRNPSEGKGEGEGSPAKAEGCSCGTVPAYGDMIVPTITNKWHKGYGGGSGNECGNMVIEDTLYEMTHGDNPLRKCKKGVSPTLRARMGCGGNQVPVLFEKANTLRANAGAIKHMADLKGRTVLTYSFDSLSSNSMKSGNPYSGCREVEISKTVDTTDPTPSKNQGGIGIVESYCIAGNTIGRETGNGGNGTGFQKDISYTLTSMDRHAVYSIGHDERSSRFSEGVTDPLTATDYKDSIKVSYGMRIRKLTPLECERLQGLPDNYTLIDKTSSDTARYKAIGNGMAQPCADYVLKRIVETENEGTCIHRC